MRQACLPLRHSADLEINYADCPRYEGNPSSSAFEFIWPPCNPPSSSGVLMRPHSPPLEAPCWAAMGGWAPELPGLTPQPLVASTLHVITGAERVRKFQGKLLPIVFSLPLLSLQNFSAQNDFELENSLNQSSSLWAWPVFSFKPSGYILCGRIRSVSFYWI